MIWKFPRRGVPPNHPVYIIFIRISIINHPFWGIPMAWESPLSSPKLSGTFPTLSHPECCSPGRIPQIAKTGKNKKLGRSCILKVVLLNQTVQYCVYNIHIYIIVYIYIYICIYIYINIQLYIYIYIVYIVCMIPIAIQWVGRTPWFCKYDSGAWPPRECPSITKSMGFDLPRHGFHYKIKVQRLLRKHS